jgi:hypothetical protein
MLRRVPSAGACRKFAHPMPEPTPPDYFFAVNLATVENSASRLIGFVMKPS